MDTSSHSEHATGAETETKADAEGPAEQRWVAGEYLRRRATPRLDSLACLFRHASDLVWVTAPGGGIEHVNPAFEQRLGISLADCRGKLLSEVIGCEGHDARFYARVARSASAQKSFRNRCTLCSCDGVVREYDEYIWPVFDELGALLGFLTTARQSPEAARSDLELYRLAYYDSLTGLPNRQLFFERLTHALSRVQRTTEGLGVLFIDLDGFKPVNDTHGHDVGDQVLVEIARRLQLQAREGDTVARLGGDEFVLLLEGLPPSHHCVLGAMEASRRILESMADPVCVPGHRFTITPSIGICHYGEHADTADVLVKRADQAMYEAKRAGGNTFRFGEEIRGKPAEIR